MTRSNQEFADYKIKVSKDVKVTHNSTGYAVLACKNIAVDVSICSIPKSAILSIRNTAVAADLPTPESRVEHHVLLAVSFLYEKSLQDRSPWYTFITSLPTSQHCGIQIDRDSCRGTSLYHTLRPYKADIQAAWDRLQPLLEAEGLCFTYAEMLDALSLVSTRSFKVDAFHGDAFVPFADLFNHKSGAEHIHLLSEQNVCLHCGFKFCDCLIDEKEETVETQEGDEEQYYSDSDGGDPDDSDDEDYMDMTTIKPCLKGKEIYNTVIKSIDDSFLVWRIY